MNYFRLLKPDWAKPSFKKDGKDIPNPNFIKEIPGPDTIGDEELSDEDVQKYNEMGYNVYFHPNYPSVKPKHKFFSGKDIDLFSFVFLDVDLKDRVYESKEHFLSALEGFPARPSLVVDSGHGIHAYWKIDDLTRDAYIFSQFALIQYFKTDDSIWTPLQLMRYPGSVNTKNYHEPKQTRIIEELSSGQTYSLSELLSVLPPISEDNEKRAELHIAKLEGRYSIDMEALANPDELPERFLRDMRANKKMRDLFEDPKGTCGDRSSADMTLANLLFTLDYPKKDVFQVLMNSKKARSRSDRQQYAFNTVDKVYKDRPTHAVESAFERRLKGETIQNLGYEVRGPAFWDCLHHKWKTKQVLGLVAGSGVGKTTSTLQMFKSMIENNPNLDHIYVFFSLEMTEGEIYEAWELLVGERPEFFKRLYVVSNEDDQGNPRNIGLQEIFWHCRDIQKSSGKKIMAVAIDHLDAISRHINLTKKPDFGVSGADKESYRGDMVTVSKGTICSCMKRLAKSQDVFLILQSQTTKAKDGGGDLPLGKNAAYGVSNFEWYCDYIMTLWRPLKRVQDRTKLRVTGWQYAKIRKAHKNDEVDEGIAFMLKFNQDEGSFSALTRQELELANDLSKQAEVLRNREEKRKSVEYHNSPTAERLSLVLKEFHKKEGA